MLEHEDPLHMFFFCSHDHYQLLSPMYRVPDQTGMQSGMVLEAMQTMRTEAGSLRAGGKHSITLKSAAEVQEEAAQEAPSREVPIPPEMGEGVQQEIAEYIEQMDEDTFWHEYLQIAPSLTAPRELGDTRPPLLRSRAALQRQMPSLMLRKRITLQSEEEEKEIEKTKKTKICLKPRYEEEEKAAAESQTCSSALLVGQQDSEVTDGVNDVATPILATKAVASMIYPKKDLQSAEYMTEYMLHQADGTFCMLCRKWSSKEHLRSHKHKAGLQWWNALAERDRPLALLDLEQHTYDHFEAKKEKEKQSKTTQQEQGHVQEGGATSSSSASKTTQQEQGHVQEGGATSSSSASAPSHNHEGLKAGALTDRRVPNPRAQQQEGPATRRFLASSSSVGDDSGGHGHDCDRSGLGDSCVRVFASCACLSLQDASHHQEPAYFQATRASCHDSSKSVIACKEEASHPSNP